MASLAMLNGVKLLVAWRQPLISNDEILRVRPQNGVWLTAES